MLSYTFVHASAADYTVVDNTKDGVHDGMAATLIQIGTDYLNGVTTSEQALQLLNAYIASVSGGQAS